MSESRGCRHIGVIMDGNGRWAAARGLPRTAGHLEGLKAARRIVGAAAKMGLPYITLYVFSTENWARAAQEVDFIMNLVNTHLLREMQFYAENGIRIRHTGDKNALPADVRASLTEAMEKTADFTGTQVALALNYGGRDEIIRAAKRAAEAGAIDANFSEAHFSAYLDNPDIPDPDLIIRTGDVFRSSNFLLWEGAYSEYYFSPKFWPDWTESDLQEALNSFNSRERRFGGV